LSSEDPEVEISVMREEFDQRFGTVMFGFFERFFPHIRIYSDRVIVFIDGGYLQKCTSDQGNLDIPKFVEKLVASRRLMRTYYYTAEIKNPPDSYWREQRSNQQRYLDALTHQPYIEVRRGHLKFSQNRGRYEATQKGVDVLLALDMLRFALKGNYDTATLVSGDGDFAEIVRMVKDEGKRVEVAATANSLAPGLKAICDHWIPIDDLLLDGCWRPVAE
jgi:uncharacterized LabA/DUF88 family protein